MPTVYKSQFAHKPLQWASESERISKFLNQNSEALARLLQADSQMLDEDELRYRIDEIDFFLFRFILDCSALSLESPNKIAADLRSIVRDPDGFIQTPDPYIPEAKARMSRWYYKDSPKELHTALLWEIEQATLDPDKVKSAAKKALEEIKQEKLQRRNAGKKPQGRLGDQLLMDFALGAAEIFARTGQKVTNTKNGPFWRFIELLRQPILQHAMRAGSTLTIESIVRTAQTETAKLKL